MKFNGVFWLCHMKISWHLRLNRFFHQLQSTFFSVQMSFFINSMTWKLWDCLKTNFKTLSTFWNKQQCAMVRFAMFADSPEAFQSRFSGIMLRIPTRFDCNKSCCYNPVEIIIYFSATGRSCFNKDSAVFLFDLLQKLLLKDMIYQKFLV